MMKYKEHLEITDLNNMKFRMKLWKNRNATTDCPVFEHLVVI